MWLFDIMVSLEVEKLRIFPFKCGKLSWQARVFANRFEVKSAIRDVSLWKASSSACTQAIRPETTTGHKTQRVSSSRGFTARSLPVNVILSRWNGTKEGKVLRPAAVFLSVLQKWSCAFRNSTKLAKMSTAAGLPGLAFTIKVMTTNLRVRRKKIAKVFFKKTQLKWL